jgi:SAM-dependent methyltransferase
VYTDSGNISTNRKLWDNYAKEWDPNREWVKRMAGNLSEEEKKLRHVGDEWSDVPSLNQVIREYIEPFVSKEFQVAEIGSGGGRVTTRVCELDEAPKSIHCFDISKEMLKRAYEAVQGITSKVDVKFCLLKENSEGLSAERFHNKFDFVYSFDVFVHMDLHTIWKYLNQIRGMLRPKTGKAFISTSNLNAPLGWKRFAKQEKFSVGGFYFVTPDLVRLLIKKSGLKIVKESKIDASNLYYNRDYLVVLERA